MANIRKSSATLKPSLDRCVRLSQNLGVRCVINSLGRHSPLGSWTPQTILAPLLPLRGCFNLCLRSSDSYFVRLPLLFFDSQVAAEGVRVVRFLFLKWLFSCSLFKLKLLFRDWVGDTDESSSSLPPSAVPQKVTVADGWAPETKGEQWKGSWRGCLVDQRDLQWSEYWSLPSMKII